MTNVCYYCYIDILVQGFTVRFGIVRHVILFYILLCESRTNILPVDSQKSYFVHIVHCQNYSLLIMYAHNVQLQSFSIVLVKQIMWVLADNLQFTIQTYVVGTH